MTKHNQALPDWWAHEITLARELLGADLDHPGFPKVVALPAVFQDGTGLRLALLLESAVIGPIIRREPPELVEPVRRSLAELLFWDFPEPPDLESVAICALKILQAEMTHHCAGFQDIGQILLFLEQKYPLVTFFFDRLRENAGEIVPADPAGCRSMMVRLLVVLDELTRKPGSLPLNKRIGITPVLSENQLADPASRWVAFDHLRMISGGRRLECLYFSYRPDGIFFKAIAADPADHEGTARLEQAVFQYERLALSEFLREYCPDLASPASDGGPIN